MNTFKAIACRWTPLLLGLFFTACGTGSGTNTAPLDEAAVLLAYLEENGNLVNGETTPSLVTPEQVFEGLAGVNQLVIDLRLPERFAPGHIEHAVNIQPGQVLHYFEEVIEPNSFERIVLVCDDGMLSGFVNGILRQLGYDKVFTLRNGLSSWHMDIAQDYWLPAMSNHLEGKLETTPHPKLPRGELPEIHTGKTTGYDILRARAEAVLDVGAGGTDVTVHQLMENPGAWYIVNYWPAGLYEEGHLPGAVHYAPKASLHSEADLLTLPVDRPVALYCYTGHHSSFVVAFLRLLGYEAYHMPYGANTFLYDTMHGYGIPTRTFDEQTPRGFPLIGGEEDTDPPARPVPLETEVISIEGGC
jgi:rhodanese-related sulfurtransferase